MALETGIGEWNSFITYTYHMVLHVYRSKISVVTVGWTYSLNGRQVLRRPFGETNQDLLAAYGLF